MTGRAKEDIIINGVKYFPHEIETAIEDARVQGVTPSFTAVFPYRPQGSQTEVINVVYLPSYAPDDIDARVKANDEISTISILQSGVRPYDIIPLTPAQLQKSSLGKLSRPKIRTAYENGLYDEFKANNTKLIKEYRALNLQGPVNDTEVAILKVFSDTFDIPANEIGTNTSLFEMGVSSIELIRLKVKIQTALELKVEIPIIIIMTNPTIASLAESIIDLQIAKPYNPIIPLQKGGDKTPIFLVHPGVGEALVFLNLAKYIVDRPVYALRARGFDLGETPFDSIAEIAECYYMHIKKTQPEGPYALAGYSLGSMLATEITKLLEARGDEVKFLGVLNLPPHIKWRMRQLDWVTVLLHLSYFLDLMTEEHAHEINADMHLLTRDQVLDHILENAPQYRLDEMDLSKEKMRQWADISTGLHTIAHHYDPSGMVSKMDVFHANPLKAVAPNREEWVEKHLAKWSEFVETEPRFHYWDGGHVTMLGPEHVVTFQKTLRAALKARDV
jgi:thioesterase domain-containing protein